MAELLRRIVQSQIDKKVSAARICSDCLNVRPIRDRRTRALQTLFGTVRVAAPRIKLCGCVDKGPWPFDDVSFSPLSELLPDRCTPELRRLQAELGARHSFREAARLLGTLLPCSPPSHADVTHILDWWHISMRVRHAEQALQGVYALEPVHQAGLDVVSDRVSRIRHLLWNGYHDEARRELFGVRHLASEAVYLNGDRLRAAVTRFLSRCDDLRGYLANNETALIDYGSRHRAGLPVSTSRAEGCVDEIANARMAKRRRMRWLPRGAHRVAVFRAAVLDGRFTPARVLSQAA